MSARFLLSQSVTSLRRIYGSNSSSILYLTVMRKSTRVGTKRRATAADGGAVTTTAAATSAAVSVAASAADGDNNNDRSVSPPDVATATAAAAPRKTSSKSGSAGATGPTRDRERALWARGFSRVAGVDEAGRGPLAGPVVAAACVLPEGFDLTGIDDSKKLNEQQREELYARITATPGVAYATSVQGRDVIDDVNILQATMRAMECAVAGLDGRPDYVLIDGNRIPSGLKPPAQDAKKGGGAAAKKRARAAAGASSRGSSDDASGGGSNSGSDGGASAAGSTAAGADQQQQHDQGGGGGGDTQQQQQQQQQPLCPAEAVVKGDAKVACIAAASIIAKVTRDRLMDALHAAYPQYGFATHRGYGVPEHLAAIQRFGYCAEHRRSFNPVKSLIEAGVGVGEAPASATGGGARRGGVEAAADKPVKKAAAPAVSAAEVKAAAAAAGGPRPRRTPKRGRGPL